MERAFLPSCSGCEFEYLELGCELGSLLRKQFLKPRRLIDLLLVRVSTPDDTSTK
jgi:hypothetical protein